MFNDIVGVALILAGLVVIFVPKVKIAQILVTSEADWSKVVDKLIDKLPARILLGLILIGLGMLLIDPALAPWAAH